MRDNIASSRGTMYVISDDGKGCEVVVKVPIRIDRAETVKHRYGSGQRV